MKSNRKKSLPRPRRQGRSRAWLRRLEAVESPDVTYLGERFPIVMKRARGLIVTDVDGNRYSDFTSCFGVLALGHRHPALVNAARRELGRLVHGMGDVHPSEAKIRLLELLVKLSPFSNGKAVLGLNGSDAVDAALKTAMVVTGRHRFVSFAGGYHGLTLGPLALCDRDHFRRGFEPWVNEKSIVLPFPRGKGVPPSSAAGREDLDEALWASHGFVESASVLERLEEALRTREVAAVVVEPLQGRGGEREWPEGFMREVAMLARKYGTLLVFDEIFTGLGRTGRLWGHEWLGVTPDLLCVGKALGGGFPLSACVGECLDAWGKSTGEARHTSTFLGHPLACGVGRAALLGIVREMPECEKRLVDIERCFERFRARYVEAGLAERFPYVLRGRGYMRGLWFPEAPEGFAVGLSEALLEAGFLTLPSGPRGDVLSLTPPLVTTARDFDKLLGALLKILAR